MIPIVLARIDCTLEIKKKKSQHIPFGPTLKVAKAYSKKVAHSLKYWYEMLFDSTVSLSTSLSN